MHRNRLSPIVGLVCLVLVAGCEDKNSATNAPAPVASNPSTASAPARPSAKPLPPLVLKDFTGLGLKFQYPEPYTAELATTNPVIHQVAIDHKSEPGVLTIRYNPQDPKAEIVLDEVAEVTRQNMGPDAVVEPSKLDVAGKTYEARTIRSRQLGLVETVDVTAVVTIDDRNYVVLTHVSKDDAQRAQRMFDTVLKSLATYKD